MQQEQLATIKNVKTKKMHKKRIPPIFRLTMKSGSKIENIYNHPKIKEIVLKELVKAIQEGITYKSKSINLFYIADSNFTLEVPRDNWKTSLSTALNYFIEEEDYTKCVEIREMINKL